ncbi:MAG: GNAT family N-acetyltransferase [Undibacterium sp.]|nr:GNAT family N-acetyltransferase [Undibacterium sp.]
MQIRHATESDAPAISALVHSVAHYFTIDPSGLGAEEFFNTITPSAIAGYITAANFDYYVGVNETQQIIAAIALRDNSHLYHLFVTEKEQGKGYAKCLWLNLKDAALAHGNAGKFTVNASIFAQPMYTTFGFIQTSEAQEMHGLRFVPMVLDLSSLGVNQ